jgi:hypothetical protein
MAAKERFPQYVAMEGSSGGNEAQPSLRIELLKLLELTPRVQTSQTVFGDRFLDGQFILETQTFLFQHCVC